MIRVSVLYPKTKDSRFDTHYYLTQHVPMVQSRFAPLGLVRAEVDEGLDGMVSGEPPSYAVIGHLVFDSIETFQAGMAVHGAEILGDIPNFTNVQPTLQISRLVEV